MTAAEFSRLQVPETPTPQLVIVKNIAASVTPEKLREFFTFCGAIHDMEIVRESGDRKSQQALIQFGNPVSANTATMLSNARLEESVITVTYYFPQFNADGKSDATASTNERDSKANTLVSGWIVSGLVLTEQLVASGRSLLEKYKVMETIEPYLKQAQDMATSQAKYVDDKFHLTARAQEIDQRFNVSQQVVSAANAGKNIVIAAATKAQNAAMQYPIVQQGTQVVSDTIDSSKQMYEERKKAMTPESTSVEAE